MGIEDRPYVGTWKLNNKKIVQHTPDCLVYLNGDLTVPGTPTSPGMSKINIQPFITSVSVDAGTESGGASAQISLSIPVHSLQSIVRDANFIFRPGLEVHVYMRGYFPVRGLFRDIGNEADIIGADGSLTTEDGQIMIDDTYSKLTDEEIAAAAAAAAAAATAAPPVPTDHTYTLDDRYASGEDISDHRKLSTRDSATPVPVEGDAAARATTAYEHNTTNADKSQAVAEAMVLAMQVSAPEAGVTHHDNPRTNILNAHEGGHSIHTATGEHPEGTAHDWKFYSGSTFLGSPSDPGRDNRPEDVASAGDRFNYTSYATAIVMQEQGLIPPGGNGWYNSFSEPGAEGSSEIPHYDFREGWDTNPGNFIAGWYISKGESGGRGITFTGNPDDAPGGTFRFRSMYPDELIAEVERVRLLAAAGKFNGVPSAFSIYQARLDGADSISWDDSARHQATSSSAASAAQATSEGSVIDNAIIDESVKGLHTKDAYDDLFSYPYYHVFHGVVTQVDFQFSGGFQTASLNCASMLHFWEYQNMSTNASFFGARPTNSKLNYSLLGHNFTGMHPYQIIYTLFHDTAGAAGGVTHAIRQQTNVDAKIDGQESLFSLNIKYWEQRFQQRMIGLRMHGVSGAMYNTVQAAFLGRLSTANANNLFKSRYPGIEGSAQARSQVSSIFDQAVALGLVQGDRRTAQIARTKCGLDAGGTHSAMGEANWGQTRPQDASSDGSLEKDDVELNMFEMQAFVKDLGQLGQINMFESAYESKLDIINKVCEVTGFEFFQDVDGDFVFKPPMYNLDTSSSRIYRVEDIDLISCNWSEKEPDCTYMTVKGSHFANIAGTGLDNEWGVQGTFIDYKLVAQFGWRPGSFETAYFNDPRQMFFAAVNRTDILNVGVNSGSVTIPLRPELRPGYPIYIAHLDAFYYCNSFAHAYQAGGQCTTALQLIGKRAKFFAPGRTDMEGIDAIRLEDMLRPPKPLSVYEQIDGEYIHRIKGYPNVVMALDPTALNPMFFITGVDGEALSQPDTLRSLLRAASKMNQVVTECTSPADKAKGEFKYTTGEGTNITTTYITIDPEGSARGEVRSDGQLGGYTTGSVGGTVELSNVAAEREEILSTSAPAAASSAASIRDLSAQMAANKTSQAKLKKTMKSTPMGIAPAPVRGKPTQGTLNDHANFATRSGLEQDLAELSADWIKLDAEHTALQSQYAASQEAHITSKLTGATATAEQQMLSDIVKLASQHFSRGEAARSGWNDLDSSSNLLDLISNKKAIFTNGELPGQYRYYSSAAPTADDQGDAWDLIPPTATGAAPLADRGLTGAGGNLNQATNTQWLTGARITTPSRELMPPEAALGSGTIFKGLYVERHPGTREVMATEDIHQLMFSIHKVKKKFRVERQGVRVNQSANITFQQLVNAITQMWAHTSAGGQRADDWGTSGYWPATIPDADWRGGKPEGSTAMAKGAAGNKGRISCAYAQVRHLIFGDTGGTSTTNPAYRYQLEDAGVNGTGSIWLRPMCLWHTLNELILDHDDSAMFDRASEKPDKWTFQGSKSSPDRAWDSGAGMQVPKLCMYRGSSSNNQMTAWAYVSKPAYSLVQSWSMGLPGLVTSWGANNCGLPTWGLRGGATFLDDNACPVAIPVNMTMKQVFCWHWDFGFENGQTGKAALQSKHYTGSNAPFRKIAFEPKYPDRCCQIHQPGWYIHGASHFPANSVRVGNLNNEDIMNLSARFQGTEGYAYSLFGTETDSEMWPNVAWGQIAGDKTWGMTLGLIMSRGLAVAPYNRQEVFEAFQRGAIQQYAAGVYNIWKKAKRSGSRVFSGVNRIMSDVFDISVNSTVRQDYVTDSWKTVETQAPVFPVSDAKGYTVVGNYRYGRGLDILADNPMQNMQKVDPTSAIDKKYVDDFVQSLVSGTHNPDEQAVIADSSRVVTDQIANYSSMSGQEQSIYNLEVALANNFSAQEIIDYGLGQWDTEADHFDLNFQNWLANKQFEGTQKLVVENAAYSLADLGSIVDDLPPASAHRGAESSVAMRAFSTDFANVLAQQDMGMAEAFSELDFGSDGKPLLDAPSVGQVLEQGSKTPLWQDYQAAIRGYVSENLSGDNGPFSDAWGDFQDTINKSVAGTQAAGAAFDQAVDNEKAASEAVKTFDWDTED